MRRLPAAAGTLLFLVVAPGVVGVLVPWQLTGWHSAGPAMWLEILGRILLASGREYREIEAGERWPNLGDVPPDLRAVRVASDVSWGARRLRLDQRWCHRLNR